MNKSLTSEMTWRQTRQGLIDAGGRLHLNQSCQLLQHAYKIFFPRPLATFPSHSYKCHGRQFPSRAGPGTSDSCALSSLSCRIMS